MASHIENKAIQLRNQAVKKLSPGGFFKSLFGNGNKSEEAIEYYTRAGNLFKMAKNWIQAGIAFSDAADLNLRMEDHLEAAINYSDAGNCFKKCDLPKALECFLKAIKLYSEMAFEIETPDQVQLLQPPSPHKMYTAILLDPPDIDPVTDESFKFLIGMLPLGVPLEPPCLDVDAIVLGRFLTAAKLHESIAEVMEDDRDISGAIIHYEQAAELFRDENHHSMANKCMQKVAEFSALDEKYQKAIKIFQDIACFDLSSSLLQYNAKEYLFRAAICHMCNDPDIVETILNRYNDMCPEFKDSRECQLILCLLDCIELRDVESYANTIRIYDSASKLSMWHVTMLLRAKNTIEIENMK